MTPNVPLPSCREPDSRSLARAIFHVNLRSILNMADRSREFLTETASLRTLSMPTVNQIDWGFRVGIILVAIFAAAEIARVGYYYPGRMKVARTTVGPAAVATAPSVAPAASAPPTAPAATPEVAPPVAARAAPGTA